MKQPRKESLFFFSIEAIIYNKFGLEKLTQEKLSFHSSRQQPKSSIS